MEIDDEDGSTPFGRNSCGPRVGFRCNTRLPVADQSIKNNSVNVNSASVDKPGYLVVHLADPNGKIIGALAVPAGEHKNLAVPLTAQVVPGTQLIVMLHDESDGDTKFDANDKPALVNGAPVTGSLTVK